MIKESEKIYNIILKYCKDRGYIKNLKKSLKVTESERFDNKKIKTKGLDIVDAVYCIYDKPRTEFFLNCINEIVKINDVVIEAGTGTGILSFASVLRGARVYSIELNKKIYLLAKKIFSILFSKNIIHKSSISFINTDATKYKFDSTADVIINENIYTGMFYEKQVQIGNNLVKYLKKGGVAIPSEIIMGIMLVKASFPYRPKKNELFNVVEYGEKLSIKTLSESKVYDCLSFTKKNKLSINTKVDLKIIGSGEVNGILIWNKVVLPDKTTIDRWDTTFLNSDILLYAPLMKKVKKGDIVTLHIQYKYGSNPKQAKFNLI